MAHTRTASLTQGLELTGELPRDLVFFLTHHGCPGTLAHSLRVSSEAARLALHFGVDAHQARLAGWLHDGSAVIPGNQRLQTAVDWNIPILAEEAAYPLLLHQKLSTVIAAEVFSITQPAVLSAIQCHTTLKADANPLDVILFVADKLAWDQPGKPPYWESMQQGMAQSLHAAAFAYLEYLVKTITPDTGVLHPWLLQAHTHLSRQLHPPQP